MVESDRLSEIDEDWVLDNLDIADVHCGGAKDLKIHWIPVGTRFKVNEFDGAESISTVDDLIFIA